MNKTENSKIEDMKREIEAFEKEMPFLKQPKFKIYDVKQGLTIPSPYLIGIVEYFKARAKLEGYSQAEKKFKKVYLTLEDANKAVKQARHDLLIEVDKFIKEHTSVKDFIETKDNSFERTHVCLIKFMPFEWEDFKKTKLEKLKDEL